MALWEKHEIIIDFVFTWKEQHSICLLTDSKKLFETNTFDRINRYQDVYLSIERLNLNYLEKRKEN